MTPLSTTTAQPQVHGMFDPATWTVTYVVHNGPGSDCAVIDSVLDYDPKSGRTQHASADKVVEYVRAHDLKVKWILENHAHADHLSAAPYLRAQLGGEIAIGGLIVGVLGNPSATEQWSARRTGTTHPNRKSGQCKPALNIGCSPIQYPTELPNIFQ